MSGPSDLKKTRGRRSNQAAVSSVFRREDRAVEHLVFKLLVHRAPFFCSGKRDLAFPGVEEVCAGAFGRDGCWLGRARGDKERGLAGARELHLFAGVDGGEDVGEVLLRVLGADLHGFRVVERGCGVNPAY